MSRILHFLRSEPAALYVSVLGVVAAAIIANWHLDPVKAGAVSAIATALGTVLTVILAKPRHWALIGGAAAAILQALLVFNLHISPAIVAAIVAGINLVLGGGLLRPQLTPTVHEPVNPVPAATPARI